MRIWVKEDRWPTLAEQQVIRGLACDNPAGGSEKGWEGQVGVPSHAKVRCHCRDQRVGREARHLPRLIDQLAGRVANVQPTEGIPD